MSNTVILFDESNGPNHPFSQHYFTIQGQTTIVGVGLQDDDEITFEILRFDLAVNLEGECHCLPNHPKLPPLVGFQTLTCPDCEADGDATVPVRLTARNPVVVLDYPYGPLLRARYTGTGLGQGAVWLWQDEMKKLGSLEDYSTKDLTPEMRGCPPVCCEVVEWQENGVQRCDNETDMLQRQEVSNCGTTRWVDVRELNWQDTGGIRCTEHVEEKQQTNDCGDLRWVPTGTSCGWIATYELPCGGLAFRPEDDRDPEATVEIDGCGEGEVAYLYPTPMPWASKPITDCDSCVGGGTVIGYAFEGGQAACDPCAGDPSAWVRTGVRRWDGSSGDTEYGVERQEINGCGHYDWKDDGTLPWVDTGATRCVGENVEREQTTEFGQTRWVFSEATEWRVEGSEQCHLIGDTDYQVFRKELNQCGDSRWTFDRVENWEDTGSTRCATTNDTVIEVQQTTLCGDIRWVDSTQLTQVWSDTGVRTCDDTTVYAHEQNQCGRIRKTALTPVTWVETGVERCVEGSDPNGPYLVQRQETNNCGHLRWVDFDLFPWMPTGVTRCENAFIENQEVNRCGQTRWVESSIAVEWVETGVTRCENHFVEHQEVNQCGTLRWTASAVACGYLATYQLPCGGLAFRPTDLRDPEATTVLEDCDGNPQSYIYPTPRQGASTPVTDCNAPCPDNPTVLGYAVDGGLTCVGIPEPTVVGSVQIEDQIFALWSNGSKTLIY